MENQKYCKHCGTIIDNDCVVCPNCGKQVEKLESGNQGVVINNTVSATAFGSEPSPKNKIAALILCIFLGALGIHRFYVGKIGTGIIWFLTGGCFIIGWIYDIIKIASGTFKDGAGRIIK